MKRHVWLPRGTWKLYPNMYTVLVGRPGLGKGAALNPAMDLFKEAGTSNQLSDRLTIEWILEKLSKGFAGPQVNASGGIQVGTEANVLLYAPELSILVNASGGVTTLPTLADLWDAREGIFMYGTRGKGEHPIKNPCVSFLGGTTPEWLVESIPSSAVGGGFTRRVNFVFAKKKDKYIAFPDASVLQDPVRVGLVEDLRAIAQLRGEFKWDQKAIPLFKDYYESAVPDEFSDEATASYMMSRWAQAAKLGMAISASESDDMRLTARQLQMAIDEVEKVYQDIKTVFRAVGESDLSVVADKVLRFVEHKGYASRSEIMQANWRHVNSQDLDLVLITLRDGSVLKERQIGNKTVYEVIPQKQARAAAAAGIP